MEEVRRNSEVTLLLLSIAVYICIYWPSRPQNVWPVDYKLQALSHNDSRPSFLYPMEYRCHHTLFLNDWCHKIKTTKPKFTTKNLIPPQARDKGIPFSLFLKEKFIVGNLQQQAQPSLYFFMENNFRDLRSLVILVTENEDRKRFKAMLKVSTLTLKRFSWNSSHYWVLNTAN